jgi:flagellar motor switch protein FliN
MTAAQVADNESVPADLESILKIEVPLSVQIASRPMRVREISSLAPGAIIELPKLADEQLDVVIGNRPIGMGTAVKVGENFGVRITQVGTMSQRIKAMAAEPPSESAPAPDPSSAEATERAESADDTASS